MRAWWLVAAILSLSPGAATASLEVEAILEAADDVEAPALEAGLLAEIVVRPGDRVEKGDLLARLDDEAAQAEVDRARADYDIAAEAAGSDVAVRIAQKERDVAAAELERSRRTIANVDRAISQSKLDQLQLDVDRATLKIEEAELQMRIGELNRDLKRHEMTVAQKKLESRSIRAAFAGVVVEVSGDAGEWLQAGDSVARVVQTDVLRAEAVLPSASASSSLVGATVTVSSGDDRQPRATGRITFVSPIVDRFNDEVRVHAEIDNAAGKLRAGERVVLTVGAGAENEDGRLAERP